ncbi:hypothetical protein BDF14DRAFT_1864217 [Spinellus fusiger]|nr:hypothetical protein BDF14DRAFT_1864217 [Spinellus fusiger]
MELPPVVVDVCIQQLSRVPTLLEKLVSSDIASESEDLLETETFFEDTLLSEQKQASVSHILLEDTSLLEPELALKTKALHQARVTPEEKTLEDKVSELEPDIFHEVKTIHEEESTASLAESTPKRMSHSKTIDRFARWIRRSLVKSIKPVVPNMDLLCEENGQPMSIEQAIDLLIHESELNHLTSTCITNNVFDASIDPNDITVLKKSVTISKELVMEPNELVRDDKGSLPSLISSGIKTEESGLSLAQSSDSNDSNDQHSIELLSTALSSSKGGKKRSVSRLFGMRSRDKYFTSFQDIKKPSKRNVPILLGNIGRKMRKTFSRKEIKATLDHLEGLLEPQALEIEIPEPETPELEAPEPETPEPETPEPETPEEAALDPDTLIGVERRLTFSSSLSKYTPLASILVKKRFHLTLVKISVFPKTLQWTLRQRFIK